MQMITTVYDENGILNESHTHAKCDGKIEVKYVKRSPDFEKGVLVALAHLSNSNYRFNPFEILNRFEILENLIRSEDWHLDDPLSWIRTNRKYLIYFENLGEYGIYFSVDDITEFISGFASCPQVINEIKRQVKDWKTIKFLNTTKLVFDNIKEDSDYFDLSTEDLNIVPEPIEITIKPF